MRKQNTSINIQLKPRRERNKRPSKISSKYKAFETDKVIKRN